MKRNLFFEMF